MWISLIASVETVRVLRLTSMISWRRKPTFSSGTTEPAARLHQIVQGSRCAAGGIVGDMCWFVTS